MGTFDAFQRLVWSPQFKQNCFPHRSKMGVLKSFLDSFLRGHLASFYTASNTGRSIAKLPEKLRPKRIRFWDTKPETSLGTYSMAIQKLSDIPAECTYKLLVNGLNLVKYPCSRKRGGYHDSECS